MKKRILISCFILIILGITAFAFINKSDIVKDSHETASVEIASVDQKVIAEAKDNSFSDFNYDVGPRFRAIKKNDVDNATSIKTFFNDSQIEIMTTINSVEVIVIENDKQSNKREAGTKSLFSGAPILFTDAQIDLMRSFDYSTNFLIRVDYEQKNHETGNMENSYSTPHHTIVPEIQAEYIYGKKALIKYLRDNTKEVTALISEDKLKPAKLYFTVIEKGTIDNLHLDSSSGYSEIDELVTRLMTSTPGGWIPAVNSKGEKVNQELVISFGLMGC